MQQKVFCANTKKYDRKAQNTCQIFTAEEKVHQEEFREKIWMV